MTEQKLLRILKESNVQHRSPAVSSARGSPEARAAITEASTTLTPIAVFAYHAGAFVRRAQAKLRKISANFGCRGFLRAQGLFQDAEKFTLRRAMVRHSAATKFELRIISRPSEWGLG